MIRTIIFFMGMLLTSSCIAGADDDYTDALNEAMRTGDSKEYRRLVDQGPPKEKAAAQPKVEWRPLPKVTSTVKPVREYNDYNSKSYSYPSATGDSARRAQHLSDVQYQGDLENAKLDRDDANERRQEINDRRHEATMRATRELNSARARAAREAVDGPGISDAEQARRDRSNLADAYRSRDHRKIRAAQAQAGEAVDPIQSQRRRTTICNTIRVGNTLQTVCN